MTIARLLAVAATFATLVVGFASPARADQVMEGVYTYTQGDLVTTWTVYPTCVPTVGDLRDNLELPVACTLHVAPGTSRVLGGDARLTGGQWEYSKNLLDGFKCADGSTAPILEVYKFDDATLSGTRSVTHNDVCDGAVAAAITNYPFTLTYQGPPAIPTDRYPLICEPGGLKRCF